jgi:BirA family biotin operon repressor/biotin-[acetyl-CoA-carboxylase] ligase
LNPIDARILAALRSATLHQPASDLASDVEEDAATVVGRIAELRAAGFEIEDRPGFGFRLLTSPDRLIADDLVARLGPCASVREVLVFEETESTNEVALQVGRDGAAPGLVVVAERQTAGRGRFGRRWESASHRGLWFSLLLRPELPLAQWSRLTTWCAVAVAACLERACDLRAEIKWPNDVFIGGRKVAGTLIESGVDPSGRPFAVAGIGINVNQRADEFPPELAHKAGSLHSLTERVFDRTDLAVAILGDLNARDLSTTFPELVAEAAGRSLLLGRCVQVHAGTTSIEGIAERLDEEGRLVLRLEDGSLRTLNAGEVTLAMQGG